MNGNTLLSARIQSFTEVELRFIGRPEQVSLNDFSIDGGIVVSRCQISDRLVRLETSPFDVKRNYRIRVREAGERDMIPDGILDRFVSGKRLGCVSEADGTAFRLFAPRAVRVHLVLFRQHDVTGTELPMSQDRDGVWEANLDGPIAGHFYGYRVWGDPHGTESFDPSVVIADPYAQAVCSLNHHSNASKGLIRPPADFDWEGDGWICPDPEDLVVYEMHVRDATAHPSSGIRAEWRGTYLGLTETGRPGGLDHLLSMNVNAVELLPCQEFANVEPDFQNVSPPRVNSGNPYARNHWGYMTSNFFAPESYYATGCSLLSGTTCGSDGRQVREFKQMVKALHRAGIAVILDVVYNHVSQYDVNPFKRIDKKYYFRLDDDQRFLNLSGCGNDFKTERPMARRLIVDSLLHWMREYHVDGFRFDLATMLDDATLDAIDRQVRQVNPRVLLIAEPWGAGKRDPAAFSSRGWASWNDEFRNGVKGQHPENGLGFIFGKWWNGDSSETVRRYVRGTTIAENGPFLKAGHAVNYLESHDDYSFGDFVRLGTGRVRADERIDDPDRNAVLTDRELKIHKLGAFFLLTSQGATMLHQGQEYARSKVIARSDVPDPAAGRLDPNSYNKDNETNWIDYGHCLTNSDLVEYYRGMIKLRRNFSAFRRTQAEGMQFLPCPNPHALGYRLETTLTGLPCVFIVLMNGDADAQAAFSIPEGRWQVLADKDKAGIFPLRIQSGGTVDVPAVSGLVLMNGPDVTTERKQRD